MFASFPDSQQGRERKEVITKLLSVDPTNYKDAPTGKPKVGSRQVGVR